MQKHLTLLVDADMFCFRACSSCERDINWGNGFWTLHVDLNEAKQHFTSAMEYAIESCLQQMEYSGDFSVVFCFSDKENFRKTILPTYKANRVGKRKPVAYAALVDWVITEYDTKIVPTLEADDCLGIIATKSKEPTVIISGDKDLKSIPCNHYDFLHDAFSTIDKHEADYNFLKQILMGDKTDGYDGCPGIGKVTAERILDADCAWEAVVAAYKKKGLSEAVALEQARVARILRASDYDFKKKEVILWTPSENL